MNGAAGSAQAKNGGLRVQASGNREAAESEATFCRKVNSVFEPLNSLNRLLKEKGNICIDFLDIPL